MTTSANERQVGGEHYKSSTGYQHWDWVTDLNLNYLVGNATKYISRWRKKNGLQDLDKAMHYVDKLIERVEAGLIPCDIRRSYMNETERFINDNRLGETEGQLMMMLVSWTSTSHLHEAKNLLGEFIAQVRKDQDEAEKGIPRFLFKTNTPRAGDKVRYVGPVDEWRGLIGQVSWENGKMASVKFGATRPSHIPESIEVPIDDLSRLV